jgi:hypothetical protein
MSLGKCPAGSRQVSPGHRASTFVVVSLYYRAAGDLDTQAIGPVDDYRQQVMQGEQVRVDGQVRMRRPFAKSCGHIGGIPLRRDTFLQRASQMSLTSTSMWP